MSPNEIRLREIVSSVLEIPVDDVSDSTSMESVEVWDSLKQMTLVLTIEERFNVSIDEAIAFDIVSVESIRHALVDLGVSF